MQKVVSLALIGVILYSIGATWDTWQFWCVSGLLFVLMTISYRDGVEEGIWITMNMDPVVREQLTKLINKDEE